MNIYWVILLSSFIWAAVGSTKPSPRAGHSDSIARTRGFASTFADPNPSVPQETTITGTPDRATGWQRFDVAPKTSFLLPGPAQFDSFSQQTAVGNLHRRNYTYESPKHLFSVEIVEGYRTAAGGGKDPAAADALTAFLERIIQEHPFTMIRARVTGDGDMTQRNYTFFVADTYINGEARIMVTPTRAVVLIAVRKGRSVDEEPVTRFFDSFRID